MYVENALRLVTAIGLVALAGGVVLDFYSVTHTGIVSQGQWTTAFWFHALPVLFLLSGAWFTWPRKGTT